MSKREVELKKLNTNTLWGIGIAVTTIVGAFWILNLHKGKSDSEREEGIDERDKVRINILEQRSAELAIRILNEADEGKKLVLSELRQQAIREKNKIIASREQPMNIRLAIEKCNEAAADCEHIIESGSDPNLSDGG